MSRHPLRHSFATGQLMVRQKLPVPCSVQHQDDPRGPFSHQSVGFYMDQRQSGVRCKPNFLRTTYVIVRLAIQHARSTNDSHTKEPAKFALDFASCSSSTFQNNTVVGHFAPRHHISPLIYGSTPHLRSSAVASIVIDIDHIYLSIRSCTNVRQQRKFRAILPVAVRDFWGF